MFGKSTANTVVGTPRPIRSDEWLVNTPFTIAQANNQFRVVNSDIGSGEDMAIALDVPYLDWSAVFRPQNALFFVAPLDMAFAFKWWLLYGLLLIAVYLFVLSLYPKRYLLASLLALLFAASPFIQWWYQTATLLPIAYGLLGIVIFLKLLKSDRFVHKLLLSVGLSYLAVCFALLMYPAFQIIVAIAAIGIIVAILLADGQIKSLLERKNIIFLLAAIATSVAIFAVFLVQHKEAVVATLSTEYPGGRSIRSGGFNTASLTTWPFSYLLLEDKNGTVLGDNQSEASNFMLFGIVALPFLLLEYRRKKQGLLSKRELYLLYAMCVLLIGILWRMTIPVGDALFNLIGLSKVPHVRLILGLGIVNLVLLMILVGRRSSRLTSPSQIINRYHVCSFFAILFVYLVLNYYAISHFDISSVGWKKYFAISLVAAVITTALLSNYRALRYMGLGVGLVFTVASTTNINPVQRGLSITNNEFTAYVQQEEVRNADYWISEQPPISALLVAAGAETYSGVNAYPQLHLWDKYFPRSSGIYNRYAHVRFQIDQGNRTPTIALLQADSFQVTLSDCAPILKELNVGYIVSERRFTNVCFTKHTSKQFENKTLHIYSR